MTLRTAGGLRHGVHSGGDGSIAGVVAGQPSATGLHPTAPAGGGGNTGHGCHADRDAQARRAALLLKGFKAYQPLNCWWAEQGAMLYSEFRDGNVPAGHEQLRVLKASLAHLPASVTKVYLRSDTAGYQEELLLYCGEGTDPRFGVIDFAISADVTEAFRRTVMATAETEWQPLIRMVDGKPQQTDQEWAEVCLVPGIGPDTAASGRITASWRSANRCGSCRWAIRRNCCSRRRNSVPRAPTSCSAW